MANNKGEFWNSDNFWMPVFFAGLLGCLFATLIGTFIWDSTIIKPRKKAFVYKDNLFRSASGEKIDGKDAYVSGQSQVVWVGQSLLGRSKKGIELEDTIKEVQRTKQEFEKVGGGIGAQKNQPKIEEYKRYLRSNYHTSELILYLSDNDYDWSRLISDGKNVEELKGILAGGKYIPQKPDYHNGMRNYILIWIMIWQLGVYSIAFGCFKSDTYHYESYLKKIHIGIGGVLTFILFSPGALPVIIVQLVIVGVHRRGNNLEDRKRQRENRRRRVMPSLDIDNDSGQALLEKLQKRINTSHS